MRFEDTILMKMPVADVRYPARRELFGVQLRWVRTPRVSRAAMSGSRPR